MEKIFTLDDLRIAFEGGRDSVSAEMGYEHFGDMEPYAKKVIVKSFKQWLHDNHRMIANKTNKQPNP